MMALLRSASLQYYPFLFFGFFPFAFLLYQVYSKGRSVNSPFHLNLEPFFSARPSVLKTLQHSQTLLLRDSVLNFLLVFHQNTDAHKSLKSMNYQAQRSNLLTWNAILLREVSQQLTYLVLMGYYQASSLQDQYLPLATRLTQPQPYRMFIKSQTLLCLILVLRIRSFALNSQGLLLLTCYKQSQQSLFMEHFQYQCPPLSLEFQFCKTTGETVFFGVGVVLHLEAYMLVHSFLCVFIGGTKIFKGLYILFLKLSKALQQTKQLPSTMYFIHQYQSHLQRLFSTTNLYFFFSFIIQKYQMEYDDNTNTNHLKNYGQWFQSKGFSQYKVPKTVLQNEYIVPASYKEKKSKDNQCFAKGFHFQKAKKPKLFLTSKNPGPALYDLSNNNGFKPIENKPKKSKSKSKSKRLQNISKEKVKLPGVGAYNVDYSQHNKKYKENKFGKAEKASYFQQAMLNGTLTPGPGQYYQKINRSKSLVLLPKSLNLQQLKQPKAKKSSMIGPGSYQIRRSSSVTCFALLNNPYKQKDESMKSRINELRKSKQSMRTPDPGKYIRIEQWGKFDGSRQISNGLKNLSKPELKIYN